MGGALAFAVKVLFLPRFNNLEVSRDTAAMRHLGKHDVLFIDFSVLPAADATYEDYISAIEAGMIAELGERFAEAASGNSLPTVLDNIFARTGQTFCFVMDEWDSMFFNPNFTEDDRAGFLMFLKQLLKSKPYVELAYMTGILPIAKHSAGSELNMFNEYSAAGDPVYERFFGFTEDEVRALCSQHLQARPSSRVDFDGLAYWYDGYLANDGSRRFNPRSVVSALSDDCLRNHIARGRPGYGSDYRGST